MYVATSTQMKKYDERLLNEGYTIQTLVDKASDCLLLHCKEHNNIGIICGPGNNGADGISLAIKLTDLGKQVQIYIVYESTKSSLANRYYLDIAKENHIPITTIDEYSVLTLTKSLKSVELIVDAMFGFGLHSNPRGVIEQVITIMNHMDNMCILSIDIPTGLNCDTGEPYENVVIANKTITLTALKKGFLNPASKRYTGEVLVEVLETKDFREEQGIAKIIDEEVLLSTLKYRKYHGHKGDYGKVLHITGSSSYRGATLLSAKAAVYTGSGVVSVCSTKEVLNTLTTFVPEATTLVREETLDNTISNRYDAILVGCGLGLSKHSYGYVKELLEHSTRPLIIDADALTIVAENKDILKSYQAPVILTPHMGEFKRFVPNMKESDIIDVAREFAREYGVILILKGPNTMITDGTLIYYNTTGNSAMSTAGMGDVLAGIVSSFVGQGYPPITAALLSVYLHGRCGDIIAEENYTAVASMILNEIPKQMKKMLT